MENYFIVDVETCPIDLENYNSLNDEEKLKLLNPIDSKIIALGIRYKSKNIVLCGSDFPVYVL